ncbi:RNA polymerase sigma E factor [Gammaproteobacteria bacterium]
MHVVKTDTGDANLDQSLVERVQRGDKQSFDILVRKYQHKIVHLIARYVHDQGEVMDLAQETFIKAYRALPNFRGESAFYTWLYRIAVNTAKNYLINRERHPRTVHFTMEDDPQGVMENEIVQDLATPENLLLRDEIERTVFETIAQLPEELRVAITLREMEGLNYEEIAQAMGCPLGTVRSRIFRAREAIDQKLKPLLEN